FCTSTSFIPRSKMTAADNAKGSLVKKFKVCFFPFSLTTKSLDRSPPTKWPDSSFTVTGTMTWLTLVTILNSCSWVSLSEPLFVALPCGTVLTFSGGRGPVGCSSAESARGGGSFAAGCWVAGAGCDCSGRCPWELCSSEPGVSGNCGKAVGGCTVDG